jgi:hypothetical protein
MASTRSYSITRRCRASHTPFVLNTSGDGRGYQGGPESGFYPTEERAREVGELWVETGIPACFQTADSIAAVRAEVIANQHRRAA